MKTAFQTALEQGIEESGEGERIKVRSYSGRGMYGRTCIGVTGSGVGEIMSLLVHQVIDENRDEIAEAVQDLQTDQMGRGLVVYFPSTEFVEGDDDAT